MAVSVEPCSFERRKMTAQKMHQSQVLDDQSVRPEVFQPGEQLEGFGKFPLEKQAVGGHIELFIPLVGSTGSSPRSLPGAGRGKDFWH